MDADRRDRITFHDGTPLTGDAVVTSFERGRSSPVLVQALADIESVTAEGQVVTVRTRRPWVALDYGLTTQVGFIASPAWLAAVGAGTAEQTEPVGTGPFRFESYQAGGSVSVVRNEDYWRTDDDDRLPTSTASTSRSSRTVGASQGIAVGRAGHHSRVPGRDRLRPAGQPGRAGAAGGLRQRRETVHVLVNNADGVMSDLEIRRALAQATNAELVNEAVGGGISEVANGPFPPGDTGHVEDNGYPEYDRRRPGRQSRSTRRPTVRSRSR